MRQLIKNETNSKHQVPNIEANSTITCLILLLCNSSIKNWIYWVTYRYSSYTILLVICM